MSSRSLWYVVTPVYKPAPGGGAIYTDILARALAAEGADVWVESEAFPGQPKLSRLKVEQGSLTIDRRFPLRAGRAERDWRSYLAYAVQNLKMVGMSRRLARVVRTLQPGSVTVLVHSSLLYSRGLLPTVLNRLRRAHPGVRLVLDVRDPKFDEDLAPVFARFDAAIGCSQAIGEKLRALLPERVEVLTIPIPFERPEPPSEHAVAEVLREHRLQGIPYVLNPNGIADWKRYPEMLEVVRALRLHPGYERACLVTVGRARDWCARDDAATREGILRYLGVVHNRTALALAKGALATLILSRVEGIPRAGLETLAMGTPLLAPDIKEFAQWIPSSVARSDDPREIASQILTLATHPPAESYPLETHEMANLVQLYRSLERPTTIQEITS